MRELGRRGVECTRRAQVDPPVRHRRALAAGVAARQRRVVVGRQTEAARRHLERAEDPLLDELVERRAGDLLDEQPGNAVAGVRVAHARAGPPAHATRRRIAHQHLVERHVGRGVEHVGLVEVHVVEPGGVLEHVADGDRRVGRPRVLDRHLRQQIRDLGVEIELAVLVQLDQRQRHEALAHRTGAEVRVRGDRQAAIAIGPAHAPGPLGAVHVHERDPGPGHARLVEDSSRGRLELVERLRRRVVERRRNWLRRATAAGGHDSEHDEQRRIARF